MNSEKAKELPIYLTLKEVAELLRQYGYTQIEIRKDLQGKERMIKAHLQNINYA